LQRKDGSTVFSVLTSQVRFLFFSKHCGIRNRVDIPPILLLRQAFLRAILAGFGMGISFSPVPFPSSLISPAQS